MFCLPKTAWPPTFRPQVPVGVRVLNEHLAESVGRLSRYLDEAEHRAEMPIA